MSDNSEGNQPQNSEAVSFIRSNIRKSLKVSRDDKRIKTIDSIRVGIGELANLKNYTAADVTEIAGRIKQQKNAKPKDLNCLAHAFIQSSDNITCFLNITGALNVLVKELTGKGVEINRNNYDEYANLMHFLYFWIGNDPNTQILATECLCNLSLGTEIACEKLTLNAGTYLITFLNCQNERIAVNS